MVVPSPVRSYLPGRVALSRALYATWDEAAPSQHDRSVDVHFVHPPADTLRPGAVWCEAALDGVVLDDPSGVITRALYDVRRSIAEGRVVRRAATRLKALDTLFDEQGWANVVREAQEIVELALRGLLRHAGVEPPRIHDVADVLRAERTRLPAGVTPHLDRLADISRTLRRDETLRNWSSRQR